MVNANRAPNRHSVILMLALAVLAACGAAWLAAVEQASRAYRAPALRFAGEEHQALERAIGINRRLNQLAPGRFYCPRSPACSPVAIVIEHLAVPLPTTDVRVPEVYRQIAAEPGQFTILQLPLGWRNSFGVLGSERTLLQYYQTVHGKPIIGGNISRAPAFKMDYFGRIPLF